MGESILEKKERLFAMFEEMGESEVSIRYAFTPGYSPNTDMPYAHEWLRLKQKERDLDASSKRDAREEQTLLIAKRANRIAIGVALSATIAAVAAIITAGRE